MSNVIAGVVRGQYPYLEEHIAQKKAIYERYRDGFKDLPVQMNPIMDGTEPNYWLSAMIIDEDYMCKQVRDDSKALYVKESGKACPTEILETLASYNAEGRPIWKPMHVQAKTNGVTNYINIISYCSLVLHWNGICNRYLDLLRIQ